MRNITVHPKKTIATAVATAFLSTQVAFAHVAVLPPMPAPAAIALRPLAATASSFTITPPTIADVLSSLPSLHGTAKVAAAPQPGRPVVVLVQDIHKNAEAQGNIAKALAALSGRLSPAFIGLEGAFRPVDIATLRRLPHPKSVRAVADFLYERHRISGPAHAALTSTQPLPALIGIDDTAGHAANVAAVRAAEARRPFAIGRLAAETRLVERRKADVFSPALRRFDAAVQARRSERLNWGEHVRRLAEGRAITPAIQKFLSALEAEKTVDAKAVEAARTVFITRLSERLPARDREQLVGRAVALRTGATTPAAFYADVVELGRRHGVAVPPALAAYLRYVKLADGIDVAAVTTDADAMERSAFAALARTTEERALVRRSERLHLAGRLINLSLTAAEHARYRELGPDGALGDLSPFEAFYNEALRRDARMAANVERHLSRRGGGLAAVVAGGFHTDGLTQALAREGFGVVLFTPRLTRVDTESGAAYLSAFCADRTPLERLFDGDKLFLAAAPMTAIEPFEALTNVHAAVMSGNADQGASHVAVKGDTGRLETNGARYQLSADRRTGAVRSASAGPSLLTRFAAFFTAIRRMLTPTAKPAGPRFARLELRPFEDRLVPSVPGATSIDEPESVLSSGSRGTAARDDGYFAGLMSAQSINLADLYGDVAGRTAAEILAPAIRLVEETTGGVVTLDENAFAGRYNVTGAPRRAESRAVLTLPDGDTRWIHIRLAVRHDGSRGAVTGLDIELTLLHKGSSTFNYSRTVIGYSATGPATAVPTVITRSVLPSLSPFESELSMTENVAGAGSVSSGIRFDLWMQQDMVRRPLDHLDRHAVDLIRNYAAGALGGSPSFIEVGEPQVVSDTIPGDPFGFENQLLMGQPLTPTGESSVLVTVGGPGRTPQTLRITHVASAKGVAITRGGPFLQESREHDIVIENVATGAKVRVELYRARGGVRDVYAPRFAASDVTVFTFADGTEVPVQQYWPEIQQEYLQILIGQVLGHRPVNTVGDIVDLVNFQKGGAITTLSQSMQAYLRELQRTGWFNPQDGATAKVRYRGGLETEATFRMNVSVAGRAAHYTVRVDPSWPEPRPATLTVSAADSERGIGIEVRGTNRYAFAVDNAAGRNGERLPGSVREYHKPYGGEAGGITLWNAAMQGTAIDLQWSRRERVGPLDIYSDNPDVSTSEFAAAVRAAREALNDLPRAVRLRLERRAAAGAPSRLIVVGRHAIGAGGIAIPEFEAYEPGYTFDEGVLGATYTPAQDDLGRFINDPARQSPLAGLMVVRVYDEERALAATVTHEIAHWLLNGQTDADFRRMVNLHKLRAKLYPADSYARLGPAPYEFMSEIFRLFMDAGRVNAFNGTILDLPQQTRAELRDLDIVSARVLTSLYRGSNNGYVPTLFPFFREAVDIQRLLQATIPHLKLKLVAVTEEPGRFQAVYKVSRGGRSYGTWTATSETDAGSPENFLLRLTRDVGDTIEIFNGFVRNAVTNMREWVFNLAGGDQTTDIFAINTDRGRLAALRSLLVALDWVKPIPARSPVVREPVRWRWPATPPAAARMEVKPAVMPTFTWTGGTLPGAARNPMTAATVSMPESGVRMTVATPEPAQTVEPVRVEDGRVRLLIEQLRSRRYEAHALDHDTVAIRVSPTQWAVAEVEIVDTIGGPEFILRHEGAEIRILPDMPFELAPITRPSKEHAGKPVSLALTTRWVRALLSYFGVRPGSFAGTVTWAPRIETISYYISGFVLGGALAATLTLIGIDPGIVRIAVAAFIGVWAAAWGVIAFAFHHDAATPARRARLLLHGAIMSAMAYGPMVIALLMPVAAVGTLVAIAIVATVAGVSAAHRHHVRINTAIYRGERPALEITKFGDALVAAATAFADRGGRDVAFDDLWSQALVAHVGRHATRERDAAPFSAAERAQIAAYVANELSRKAQAGRLSPAAAAAVAHHVSAWLGEPVSPASLATQERLQFLSDASTLDDIARVAARYPGLKAIDIHWASSDRSKIDALARRLRAQGVDVRVIIDTALFDEPGRVNNAALERIMARLRGEGVIDRSVFVLSDDLLGGLLQSGAAPALKEMRYLRLEELLAGLPGLRIATLGFTMALQQVIMSQA